MAKFEWFIVILLMCLMTGQQTNAQQQQVPAKIAEDNANNKSPTIQQQQQPQLAKVALEKQAIAAPAAAQPNPAMAMESAYEVPAVAGKIAGDGKDVNDKDKVVVISDKTLSEHQAAVAAAAAAAEGAAHPPQVVPQQQEQKPPAATKPESKPKGTSAEASDDSKSTNDNNNNNSDDSNKLPHEDDDESLESSQNANVMKIKNKPLGLYPDMDIDDDSYKTASLFFLGISSFAVLFIAYKIYRMRLTRAERKYGVQGNRAAQELTPLPMSVDDAHGNSDDEDHTLFDRHQVRIL